MAVPIAQKYYALYLVHRRSEHNYREWIIMPSTDVMPINVWTRYVDKEGARPVWRGTKNPALSDPLKRADRSDQAINQVVNTLSGHYRQNQRNPEGKQWEWESPIVVECTATEVREHAYKTPYPVVNRIKRVLTHRKLVTPAAEPVDVLRELARLLLATPSS
jgi:hypothetical protein